MELLTPEIEQSIPALYSGESVPLREKQCAVKFFTPWGNWTWYAVEGERTEDGDFEFFGLVDGMEVEWGNWTLSQLESVEGPAGLKIERDLNYTDDGWKRDLERLDQ